MDDNHGRFRFELSSPKDGQELLEILEAEPFEGKIELLYTRRHDAYASFQLEGDPVEVVICRDTRTGRIAGMGVSANRLLYVNGEPREVGYLFGLRARPEYRRATTVLHRGYARLRQLQHRPPCFSLTSILEENLYARRLLEKRRPFMPVYEPLVSCTVYAMSPGKLRLRRLRSDLRRATTADLPALVRFLREQGARQQFFPFIDENSFDRPPFSGLRIEDFLLWEQGGQLVAAAGLWDQSAYRQYLVLGYRGALRVLRPLSFLLPLCGLPALPPAGSQLRFLTLSLWAVRDDNPALFADFLEQVSSDAGSYPLLLASLAAGNPLEPALAARRHIGYRSRIYLVYWPDQEAEAAAIRRDLSPYLECGLL